MKPIADLVVQLKGTQQIKRDVDVSIEQYFTRSLLQREVDICRHFDALLVEELGDEFIYKEANKIQCTSRYLFGATQCVETQQDTLQQCSRAGYSNVDAKRRRVRYSNLLDVKRRRIRYSNLDVSLVESPYDTLVQRTGCLRTILSRNVVDGVSI